MKQYKHKSMVKGWFVGRFNPTACDTANCEVAVKIYKVGDNDCAHVHRIATEITMVVEGKVRMMGQEFGRGDIIVLEPGEVTSFEALTDAINVVVKVPGALDDKFLA